MVCGHCGCAAHGHVNAVLQAKRQLPRLALPYQRAVLRHAPSSRACRPLRRYSDDEGGDGPATSGRVPCEACERGYHPAPDVTSSNTGSRGEPARWCRECGAWHSVTDGDVWLHQ